MLRVQFENFAQENNFLTVPLRTLVMVSAVAAIIGGLLLISGDLVGLVTGVSDENYTNTPIGRVMGILFLAGKVFVLLGLVGLYLPQVNAAGRFGLVAFLVLLAGTGLMIASDWSEVFVAPILTEAVPEMATNIPPLLIAGFLLNFVTDILGMLLFGIATFRARVLPRPAALLLAAGPLIAFVGPPWSWVFVYAAVVWLGVAVVHRMFGAHAVKSIVSEVLEKA